MKVSVIIPTLNEAAHIEQTLETAAAQPGPHEFIVADGGSTDATRDIAAPYAHVFDAPTGRAYQMNAGAARATGDVLLFLHADSLLPPNALSIIRRTLQAPTFEGGAFRLTFDRFSPLLSFYSFCTHFPFPSLCFGDRGLFVRRSVFEEVGGFPDQPIFEDLELVKTLHRRGGFRFLPQAVSTSSRRFEAHGMFKQQMLNSYLWVRYQLGAPVDTLAPFYPYTDDVTPEERPA